MVRRSRGPRSKTRYKMKKEMRSRGLPPISKFMRKFEVGNNVTIKVNPSVVKGRPSLRFHGMDGKVLAKKGDGYVIQLKEGNKSKRVISSSVHIVKR